MGIKAKRAGAGGSRIAKQRWKQHPEMAVRDHLRVSRIEDEQLVVLRLMAFAAASF
jgi:hypothetical protein